MATRTVTSTILRPDGTAWAGGIVRFRLTPDTYRTSPTETYPEDTIEAVADASGAISATLVSGDSLVYRVTLPSGDQFDIAVPDGSATTLEALRASFAGAPVAVGSVEDALDALGFEEGPYLPLAGGTVTGAVVVNAAVTVNDTGADVDTRIEGDTDANLLLVDASTDRVGVGTATPGSKLDVRGGLTVNEDGADVDTRVEGDTDANLLVVDAGADSVGIGVAAPTAWLHVKAGTTAQPPLKLSSGTNLTTPEAGAIEYDGANFFQTANETSDRADDVMEHVFELNANGSNIGPSIADFFGANSAIDLPASSRWELEARLYYTKNTAGTVTWTITNSAANYTNIAAHYVDATGAGASAYGAANQAAIVGVTTAAAALPATSSRTAGETFFTDLYATIDMNAAGNVRIRVTSSAGTVTPLRGSYFKIRRLPQSVGAFVA